MIPDATEITSAFPATRMIFRDDAYAKEAEATVLGAAGDFLVLDSTLFYAASGGQPADHGTITLASGEVLPITEVRFLDPAKTRIGHALPPGLAAASRGRRCALRSIGSGAIASCACTPRCTSSPWCCPIPSRAAR